VVAILSQYANDLTNNKACESLLKELADSDLSGHQTDPSVMPKLTSTIVEPSPDGPMTAKADCKGTPEQNGRQGRREVIRDNAFLNTSSKCMETTPDKSSNRGIASIVEMPDLEGSILYDDALRQNLGLSRRHFAQKIGSSG